VNTEILCIKLVSGK